MRFLTCALLLTAAPCLFGQWQPLNPVTAVEPRPNGASFTLEHGTLMVEVLTDSVVRVRQSPNAEFPSRPDYVVNRTNWPPVKFTQSSDDSAVTLSAPRLKAAVSRRDATITFSDPAGQKLVTLGPGRLTPVTVNGESTYHSEEVAAIYGSQEGFFGLGQHQAGVWNYRGVSVDLSQENTEIAVPLLVSSNGYGIFWNNTSRTRFNNRFVHSLYIESEVADVIDYYFFYGPAMDRIVADYRELTGAPPLYCQWAYGFWQCKNKYESQAELLGVAHRYREQHIPADNIVQDWFWWNHKGEFVWNSKYPDPKAMIDELHAAHFHLMISVWPFYDRGTPIYDEFDRNGWFIDRLKVAGFHPLGMALYDATNPAARKRYWEEMNRALFSIGADAWWLDTIEPETEGQERNILLGHKLAIGSGDRFANLYPLLTAQGVYEGQRAASDAKRVFILGRSAFAGAQRYGVTAWSGDILSDWLAYRRQIPAGLNYSLSGMPYWTTDIGGFFIGNPDDPTYRELFVRWFQYGAFCPIFRVHGTRTTNQNELWSYGSQAQQIMISFDKLRYRLMPYIYSVAWMTTHDHYTPMRPLIMDFAGDRQAMDVGDQFLFGPAILVNPVTDPGATSRRLYLPKARWYDFWSGAPVEGGRSIEADAPLERIPLYVRAGSILPLGPAIEYTGEKAADPIELRVYRGADGHFTLYEDEGDTYHYEQGQYATIAFDWNEGARSLTIEPRQGSFPGMLASRNFRVVFVGGPEKTVRYSGQAVTVSAQP